jgi:phosphoribosylanthranilate isomerase
MKVKICGLTNVLEAQAAAEAGADYLGLVFAPSRRQISPVKAKEITRAIKQINLHISAGKMSEGGPQVVGVFVNLPADEVNKLAEFCELDWVQISGDEPWGYCQEIEKPIIKAIHVSPSGTAYDVLKKIEEGHRSNSWQKLICLLDTQVKELYGGTGLTFKWQLAKEIAEVFPVFVAGGLTPVNLHQLILEAHPWGVDVSSGVETEGKKDIEKIRDFMRAARQMKP